MVEKANAKINLTLDITGKRDDGYHTIHSVMQSVSLCDYVTVKKSENFEFYCDDKSLMNSDNLAVLAAKEFLEETGIEENVCITLEKCIPVGAGLGGGSSDAAAVLRAMNRLFKTEIDDEDMIKMAKTLGADVPFCLKGGTALCEGIGEIITPIDAMPIVSVLIAKPMCKDSTGNVYKRFDELKLPAKNPNKKILASETIFDVCDSLSNDFVLLYKDTPVVETAELIREFSPDGMNLSGSGPAVYALFTNSQSSDDCYEMLQRRGIESWLCETVDHIDIPE
ncbi:MAG: 4-(cytidine 5'-diphospho)-2-C-methyl-D-erythritol kinase [Acutalibacteraceae bacterium]